MFVYEYVCVCVCLCVFVCVCEREREREKEAGCKICPKLEADSEAKKSICHEIGSKMIFLTKVFV